MRKLDNRPISGTVILEENMKGPGWLAGALLVFIYYLQIY